MKFDHWNLLKALLSDSGIRGKTVNEQIFTCYYLLSVILRFLNETQQVRTSYVEFKNPALYYTILSLRSCIQVKIYSNSKENVLVSSPQKNPWLLLQSQHNWNLFFLLSGLFNDILLQFWVINRGQKKGCVFLGFVYLLVLCCILFFLPVVLAA